MFVKYAIKQLTENINILWKNTINMPGVNLDAMIQREDFTIDSTTEQKTGSNTTTLRLEDLKKDAFLFHALRKPDFQRETNEWDSEKICKLIESYVDGDLIPAVIFWSPSNSNTFVIDGSHRLSALTAWVNDDYGDGEISKQFYDRIEEEQLEIAEKTRTLIRKRIGPYTDYHLALTIPDKIDERIVKKAKTLGILSIPIQWVHGDENKAEISFFKINQQGQPLNKTEIYLLQKRRKPNVLAARAIIKSGTGHKYWAKFEPSKQSEIVELSKELFHILFRPPLDKPVKTLDNLPLAGKVGVSSTLQVIWNFVNLVNDIDNNELTDDKTGDATIDCLTNCKKLAERINSSKPASLGLHPAVYFYSYDGRHKQASFYAGVEFVKKLNNTNAINKFLKVRESFEEMLQKYNYLTQQIVRNYRSAEKAYSFVTQYYNQLIDNLSQGKNQADAINEIIQTNFKFLTIRQQNEHGESDGFSQNTKSAIFIKEALASAVKCKLCHGLIHSHSVSFDHIVRKQDGGLNNLDNGQLTHPYCNTTFKN
jgi:hypothetical protein